MLLLTMPHDVSGTSQMSFKCFSSKGTWERGEGKAQCHCRENDRKPSRSRLLGTGPCGRERRTGRDGKCQAHRPWAQGARERQALSSPAATQRHGTPSPHLPAARVPSPEVPDGGLSN